MKKTVLAFVMMLMPALIFAQAAFDKFDGKDGVTTIVVNKKMFELMGNVKLDASDKEAQQYLDLVKKLNNLKVFTTKDSRVATDMRTTVASYLKSYPLDELMRVNNNGRTIKIYVKSGKTASQVKELLMFIDGGAKDDSVIMSLTGNFDLSEVSLLTDKMSLPGGSELRKASNKKSK